MKVFALPLLAVFASTSMAATLPADQSPKTVQEAQDSVNGSMTNTKLSGNLDQDTSQLNNGTASGTSQGAIIDHTSKRKVKSKKKKNTTHESTATETESGSTSSGGYGNENLYDATTTQGRTRNDEIGVNVNSARPTQDASEVQEK